MSAMTDTLENLIADFLFRGQALVPPANLFIALCTTAPTDSTPGTEVGTTGTNYQRSQITNSLANWSGTQGAGTTAVSSGTGGQISNNIAITFNAPTGGTNWGNCQYFEVWTAQIGGGGVRWFWGQLTIPRIINSGDTAPSFGAGSLVATFA